MTHVERVDLCCGMPWKKVILGEKYNLEELHLYKTKTTVIFIGDNSITLTW